LGVGDWGLGVGARDSDRPGGAGRPPERIEHADGKIRETTQRRLREFLRHVELSVGGCPTAPGIGDGDL
jgi:hypothetical protein